MYVPVVLSILAGLVSGSSRPYYGKKLGYLSSLEHGVSGTVYAVDSKTLHIRGFNYDGQAPDAYFYVGLGRTPSGRGKKVPAQDGSLEPLGRYRNEHITLTLPKSTSLEEVQWISVWCHDYSVDFGSLILPKPITDYPRPQKIGRFVTKESGVKSEEAVVVDSKTLLIPYFSYDGDGPDAHFWAGRGDEPTENGFIVPNENGNNNALSSYDHKTIVLTLPGEKTVFDIDYLSVWCESYGANFGHLKLDHRYLNVPPSLRVLGVRPQSKLNCEVLDEQMSFEVRWAMTGESIVLQLVSKLENGQFMAFGLSGSGDSSLMTGADLTVAWMNQHSGQGRAYDYTVSSDAAQCVSSRGICKDTAMKGGKNNIRLLNSAFINGFSMLTFQRPLESPDRWDRNISSTQMQPIVWAIGDMTPESEVAEFTKLVQSDTFVNFGRTPLWNCPVTSMNTAQDDVKETLPKDMSENPSRLSKPDVKPWQIPPIPCHEPEDGVYYVQMGPAGGEQGLQAITSWPGWGMAWYINGLLIPEVNVVRGRTYTFVVEGGANPDTPAKYHPFYITDDPEGGYQFKTDEEKLGIRILAGVGLDSSGQAIPTATGRLCQWRKDSDVSTEDIGSFGAFQRTLKLECEPGQPGILQWTPDESTPDTVYYQCFTHRYLGWKIHVHDECTEEKADLNAFHDVNQTFQGDDADYDYYYDNIAEASFQKEQQYLPNNNPKSDTIEEQMNTHSLPPSSDSTHDLPDYLDYSYPEKLINRLQSAEKYSDSSAIDGNLGSKPASGFNFDQYLVSRKGLLTNSESLQADASAEENHRTIDHEQDTNIERVDNPSDVKKVPTRTSSSRRKTLLQASRRITNRNRPDNLITRRRRPQSQSDSGTSLGSAVGQATDIKKLNSALEDKSQIIKEESTTDEIAKQSIDRLYSKSDFDPQEITFETGFKPVRPVGHNNPGLAFEVEDVQVGSTAHFLDQPPTFSNKGQSIIQSSINRAKQPPQAMKIPLPVSLVPAAPAFSSQNERPLVDTGNTAPNSHHTAQTEDVEYTVELGPIPPPPHLTEEILANAIVFSPDQLPSNFQPVDSGLPQYWNKPQQHVSKGPSKGPLSFFQNLLSYIPGWGPSKPARRHFQKYPAYNQRNPNRALNVLPSRPDRRRRPVNGHYLSSPVYTNSQRINQAQFNRFQKENGEYNLPSKPRLESVIRKTNFQPSAIDSGSFSPLADVQEHSVSKKSGGGPSETFEMKRKLMDDASL